MSSSSEKVRLDDLLVNNLGQFGLYQFVHYIIVGIPSIFAGMHALSWTFAGAPVNFRCLYPGESESNATYKPPSPWYESAANLTSGTAGGCKRLSGLRAGDPLPSTNSSSHPMESCSDGYAWDHSDIAYSAVDRWSLVCDRDPIIATVQALYFVGQLLGSIFFGVLSDKIGRKPVFLMAILLQLVCGALLAVVPWWGLMTFLRSLTGFGHPGVFIMSVVVGAELVGPKYRVWSAVGAGVFWAIGEIILGALSYPLRDYRYLQLAISLPAIVLVTYWWILPESARWLMCQGRASEVGPTLNKVARWNGKRPLPEKWYENVAVDKPETVVWYKAAGLLFATPRLRIRTIITFVLWAVVTMGYYGLAINPSLMGGDNRLGFILSGVLEIPGLAYVLLVNMLGRKFIAVSGFWIAAVCLALTIAVPPQYWVANLLLVVVGKAALTGVFALVYIWTPEHYPTMIRNTATGACSMVARLGGIAASYFSLSLAKTNPQAVAITFAVSSALAGLLAIFLPETTGEPLTETIEEAEEMGLGQPICILGFRNQKVAAERIHEKAIQMSSVPIYGAAEQTTRYRH